MTLGTRRIAGDRCHDDKQRSRFLVGTELDGRGSSGDLRTGQRGRHFRAAGIGRAVAAISGPMRVGQFAGDALGDDAPASKAEHAETPEKTGAKAGTRGGSSAAAGRNSRTQGAPRSLLSALPGPVDALRADSHPLYGRHSRGHRAGGDRTCDPSRLVSALQEVDRAASARRLARQSNRQSRGGTLRLVALWTGADARPHRGGVQLPLALSAHARRARAAVVSVANDPLPLVRADSPRGARLGCSQRRRNGLACQWQGTLAVVLHRAAADVLPDRPPPRQGGDGAFSFARRFAAPW